MIENEMDESRNSDNNLNAGSSNGENNNNNNNISFNKQNEADQGQMENNRGFDFIH